jgi:DnaJ-class molecular chaperone
MPRNRRNDEPADRPCNACRGSGTVRNPYFPQKHDTCTRCYGTGWVSR